MKALDNGSWEETPAPKQLAPGQVVVLQVYGSLFYAATTRIEQLLPSAQGVTGAVLILRLRGVQQVGSTFVNPIERYAGKLHTAGGYLILAEVREPVHQQFLRTETVQLIGEAHVFPAEPDLFAATCSALAAAEKMVVAEMRQDAGNALPGNLAAVSPS